MAAETLVEVYRTQEDKSTFFFVSVCTITYFNDTAFIQGLSGNFTIQCWKELQEYLLKNPKVKKVEYIRRGKLKTIYRE